MKLGTKTEFEIVQFDYPEHKLHAHFYIVRYNSEDIEESESEYLLNDLSVSQDCYSSKTVNGWFKTREKAQEKLDMFNANKKYFDLEKEFVEKVKELGYKVSTAAESEDIDKDILI